MADRLLKNSTSLAAILMMMVNPFGFDHIGDSRTAALGVGSGTNASHLFNQASALSGQRMQLGLNLGVSGARTEQYLAAGMDQALASPNGWLVFGFPAINDLSGKHDVSGVDTYSFPYTDANGVVVTQTNVAQLAGR